MIRAKNILPIVVLIFITITGCYSEDNWLNDNWEKTGRYYPNIADVAILNTQDTYSVGDEIHLDVRFWSEDPIKNIALYHQYGDKDREVATMYSYEDAAYSEVTQTDSLVIEYDIPPDASGSSVVFEIVIENENGLSSSSNEATNTAIHNISIAVE